MDNDTKAAYRYLLYHAMLEIRPLQWHNAGLGLLRALNPLFWKRLEDSARRAGVIADMMHNLALFSALDFERFEEERFWRDVGVFEKRYLKLKVSYYRNVFEMRLAELKKRASDTNASPDVE